MTLRPPVPLRLQALGKPTYFITFTANPNWPEIRQLLKPRQNPGDRPDAVMRVFKIKLQALLDDLRAGTSLGSPSVFIFYVIEFQKRGLPHAHSECQRFLQWVPVGSCQRGPIPRSSPPLCSRCARPRPPAHPP